MSIPVTSPYVVVSIEEQTATVHEAGRAPVRYPISTSSRPPSCRENSFGTPLGLHAIRERIGDGEPEGTVFKGRRSLGKTFAELPPEERQRNLITSRILWLEGLEPGVNQGPGIDSYERYIYLHGTNHEDRIGQPFSGGCVEFRNQDIIKLFPQLPEGTLVWIE
jgi:hypothetical protein